MSNIYLGDINPDKMFDKKNNTREEILKSFYDAMPDDLTNDKCAEGTTINFLYNGKEYSINTAAEGKMFRTRSLNNYFNNLEDKVVNLVLGKEKRKH